MSRHFIETEAKSKRVKIQVGYDRPLDHMYLNVYDKGAEASGALYPEVYISMYDRNLLKPERGFRLYGGMTMQELTDKLSELGIQLPEELLAALKEDEMVKRGNLDRRW